MNLLALLLSLQLGASVAARFDDAPVDLSPDVVEMRRWSPGSDPPAPSEWDSLPDREFEPVRGRVARFGYQAGAVLLRIPVVADRPGRWWIQADYPGLDSMRIAVDGRASGWVGEAIPYARWENPVHQLSLPVDLEPGPHLLHVLVVERGGRTIVPLRAIPDAKLFAGLERSALLDGIIVGVLLTNTLVGLYLLALFRRPSHAWYVVYLASLTVFVLAHRHHGFPVVWPGATWFNQYNQSFFSLLGLGALGHFHRHVLDLRRHMPRLSLALATNAWVLVGVAALMPLTPWTHAVHRLFYASNLSSILVLTSLALGFGAVVARAFAGDRTARGVVAVSLPTIGIIVAAFLAEMISDMTLFHQRGLLVEVGLAVETSGISLLLSLVVNRERRQHAALQARHLALERSFLDRLAEESDKALRGTALDLHDGIGQGLAAARLRLHAIEDRARRDELEGLLAELSREVRATAHRMYPPDLQGGRLEQPVRRLLEGLGTGLDAAAEGECGALTETVAHHLYRIVQESVHNAFHHGGAKRIRVRLAPDRLVIEDDGRGAPEVVEEGLGMRGMRARAESIGWDVRWGSREGGGWAVEIARRG